MQSTTHTMSVNYDEAVRIHDQLNNGTSIEFTIRNALWKAIKLWDDEYSVDTKLTLSITIEED